MSLFKEEEFLVNNKDEEVGVSEKLQAHKDALLHRAVSFLYSMKRMKCYYNRGH